MILRQHRKIRGEACSQGGPGGVSFRALAIFALLLGALGSGCVGYREYYDRAADRYDAVLRETAPDTTDKRVRYTLNVAYYLGGALAAPVSRRWPELDCLARRTIRDMQIFEPGNIGRAVDRPDYHFIFNVNIESTGEPGALSGLILPFHRGLQYTARLQVLDERGELLADYAASAGTFQCRHVLLLPLAPFYRPYFSDRRARRNIFEALAVRLIANRAEFRGRPAKAAGGS